MEIENLYGRQLVCPKIDNSLGNTRTAFQGGVCQRCNQKLVSPLPNDAFYCRACLTLGRVSSLDNLISLPEPNQFNGKVVLSWTGTLASQQQKVSEDLLTTLALQREHLVWAVTGAGKTEMLFPLIYRALQQKLRIGIVAPRVDVIVELSPRLRAAFAQTDMVTLYGEQTDCYRYTQLVLATTHQLLRFRQAFDVLIIDEVDSFPFAGNEMLTHAVKNAVKVRHTMIYLTATPTRELKKRIKKGLPVSYLPLRFHQHLLPEIQLVRLSNWRKKLPRKFRKQLSYLVETNKRFLVFVPKVSDLKPVQETIRRWFPRMHGDFVHANDKHRQEKVQSMRNENLQYLVTTTILERGVTFPGIDVIILGADDEMFTENALVQIAGRVGRKSDCPTGLVLAYVEHVTLKVKAAQRQIIQLNHLGEKLRESI